MRHTPRPRWSRSSTARRTSTAGSPPGPPDAAAAGGCASLDLTRPRRRAARLPGRRRDVPRLPFARRRRGRRSRRAGALVFPALPDSRRSTPTATGSTPPAELYDDRPLRRQPRRPRLRLARPRRDRTRCSRGRCTTTPSTRRWPAGCAGARLVGVMGGHAATRRRPGVRRRRPARARCSARDPTVATGGGPGAMEAANLGARLAGRARRR